MFTILQLLQALGMYLLWGKINGPIWWILLVIFVFMYFGSKTYYTAVNTGSDQKTIQFWYQARSIIFIVDILAVGAIYLYIFI